MAKRWVLVSAVALLLGCSAGCTGEIGGREEANGSTAEDPDAPSSGPIGTGTIDASACRLPPRRLIKLTPTQHDATIRRYLTYLWKGDPPSSLWSSTVGTWSGKYSNDADRLDMSQLHVARVFEGTRKVAATQTQPLALYEYGNSLYKTPARFRCKDDVPDETCVRAFLVDYGARVFRRPLTAAEVDRYVAFFSAEAGKHGPKLGYEQVVHALSLSPHALYRTEIGDPASTEASVTLTQYERAQALSYFLTDAPPDDELREAAEKGELATKEQIAAHARRLLEEAPTKAGGARGMRTFLSEWLEWDKVRNVAKGWRYKDWGKLQRAAAVETSTFVDHWFWNDDARVETLLSAPWSFANATLAAHYGVAGPASDDTFEKVSLPKERRGLLGQTSFLATHGKPWSPDIVHRGLFIRRRLLCGTIPPPPASVPSAGALPDDPNATHNEIVASHASNPVCWTCHAQMDPLGRPFQSFDTIGRHRTVDTDVSFGEDPTKDRPLGDLRGELAVEGSETVPVSSASELVSALATSPAVQRCVALNVYRYAHARTETTADACALKDRYARFLEDGGDVRALVIDIVTSDEFLTRRVAR